MQNQCNAKFYYDQYKYVLCNSDKQKKKLSIHTKQSKNEKTTKKTELTIIIR